MMRLLPAILTLVFSASAFAKPILIQPTGFPGYCGDSLECTLSGCDTIVRATVASVGETTFEAKVTETFKGAIAPGTTITVNNAYSMIKKGQDAVLPLREEENGKRIAGTFFLRWPIILDGKRPYYEVDVQPLSTPDEIVAGVKRIAANLPDEKLERVALFSGGRILHVPANERLERIAQGWAADKTVYRRVLALQALKPFKSDGNIAIATSLLSDTRAETRSMSKWQHDRYHVRENAIALLEAWRVPVPNLATRGPILAYHQVPRMPIIWIIAIIAGIFVLAAISLRIRIVRQIAVNLLLITLILSLTLLWLRSRSHTDEFMFAAGTSHHEFTSYNGGLQYAAMRDWYHQGNAIYGSFDRSFNDDVWSIDSQNPTARKNLIGFTQASGLAAGPGGSSHRFVILRIPYWALLVPPSALLLLVALKLRRQIRRARLGLCRHCGYDLRESPGGICPECGSQISRPAPVRGSEPCLAFSSSTPAA